MARPYKKGLDYFPFDVDFFGDEKIAAVAGEFGIKGEITAVKLLCAVYRNGYFVEWNEMLQMKLLKELPGVSVELLRQIVGRLVKWGFFEESLFSSHGILTSRGIQKRYFAIANRRISVDRNLPFVIDSRGNGVSACSNGVIAYRNPLENGFLRTENPKEKESKGKKEDEKESPPPSPDNDFMKKSFEENVRLCMESLQWQETTLMTVRLRRIDWEKTFMLFKAHLLSHGKPTEKSLRDFKSHFVDWLKKQIDNQAKQQKNGNKEKMDGNDGAGGRAGLGRAQVAPAAHTPAERGRSVI